MFLKKGEFNVKINRKFKMFSKRTIAIVLAASVILTPTWRNKTLSNDMNIPLMANIANESATINILESQGWLESAHVEWGPVTGATAYEVYYKAASDSDSQYKKIDGNLIRKYPSYFRADVLGLVAGDYVVKIVPVIGGAVDISAQAITQTLQVKAQAREGFGFSAQSPMKTSSGGYNDDGTVASNAQILYITAATANIVKLDVITSTSGAKTTCTGLADILLKRQKGYDKTPLIIRMIGEVKAANISGLNSTGYLEVKGCYNVTFEGVGEDATAYGWGFLIRAARNVEIRNVGVMLFPDDGISLDTDNANIWIHNNDIFYGAPGSDADQVKGDGSTDVKGNSTYVTLSYNHYWDSGKASLCGMSDAQEFFVTYHHNWFDHSDSRHPRIRVGTIHMYNNYYDGNAKYGVGVTKGSSAFVEANYFRNCKDPMLSSLQGTDIFYGVANGTFSGEAGGMIKAYNNKVEGAARLVYAQEDPIQFDAYRATTRDEVVPSTFKTVSGGTTYNNFDTSSAMYSYKPDAPEDVKSVVTTYAGRVNGGDFKWTFTADDDTSYTINTPLKTAILNYTSSLSEGATVVKTITSVVAPAAITVKQGAAATLPSTVAASYSDGSSSQVGVTWAGVDTSSAGTKTIHGNIEGYTAGVDIQINVIPVTTDNPTPSGAIFADDFANATTSNFLTAGYKAVSPGSTIPMYVKTGGTINVATNSVTLVAGRMAIGELSTAATTSSSTPGGIFDLSKPYKITVVTGAASGTGKFQVYVDNNTTSSGNSPLGSASKVYESVGANSANNTITIEPTVGTAASFLQVRTDSSATVEIKSIKIEYLQIQTATISSISTPAGVTVEQGSAVTLPSTVNAVYSDGSEKSVAVTWAAVDTSTAGTKTIHGTIDGYATGVDIQVIVTAPVIRDETPPDVALNANDAYFKGQLFPLEVTSNEEGTITIEVNAIEVVSGAAMQIDGTGYKYSQSIETTSQDTLTIFATVKDTAGNTSTVYTYAEAKIPTIVSIMPVSSVTVEQGNTVNLPSTVTATYSDGSTLQVAVTWETVDTNVVGNYTVEGTVSGFDGKVTINVSVLEKAEATVNLNISSDKSVIDRAKTTQLVVSAKQLGVDVDLTNVAIKYVSSNPAIADIDGSGMITAYKVGTAEIKAIATFYGKEVQSNTILISVTEAYMDPVELSIKSDIADNNKFIIDVNQETTVKINVKDAKDLYGFDMNFNYDNSVFELKSVKFDSQFATDSSKANLKYTDVNGNVRIFGYKLGESQGVTGNVDVVDVTLVAKNRDALTAFEIVKGAKLADSKSLEYTTTASSKIDAVIADADNNGSGYSIGDIIAVAKAFGTNSGETLYRSILDINKDGKIDISDISYVAMKVLYNE
jgi:pectate lyase